MEGSGEEFSENLNDSAETFSTFSTLPPQLEPAQAGLSVKNPFRVAFVAVEVVLLLLVSVLTAAARRDFIRPFIFFLILPIAAQVILDVYIEVRASLSDFTIDVLSYEYYHGNFYNLDIRSLPSDALSIYADILGRYSGYSTLYKVEWLAVHLSFFFTCWLFWSLLLGNIRLLLFAQRAVLKPEEIAYIPFWAGFIRLQVLVLFLAGLDMLEARLGHDVTRALSLFGRFTVFLTTIAVFILLVITLAAVWRRKSVATRQSAYVFVRSGKSRLGWLSLFVLLSHALALPFIVWSLLSVWTETSLLLGEDGPSSWLSTNTFVLHLSLLPARPLLVCLSSLLLLPPLRLLLSSLLCCCCARRR